METISKGKRNHHEMKTRAPPKGCGPSLNAFDLIAKELKEEFNFVFCFFETSFSFTQCMHCLIGPLSMKPRDWQNLIP